MTSPFRLPLPLLVLWAVSLAPSFALDPVYLDGTTLQYDRTVSPFLPPIVLGPQGGTIPFSSNITFTGIISGAGPLNLVLEPGQRGSTLGVTASLFARNNGNTFSGGLNILNPAYDGSLNQAWLVKAVNDRALGTGPVTLSPGSALSLSVLPTSLGTNRINLVNQSALILDSEGIDPAMVISRTSSQGVLELGATSRSRYGRSLNMAWYGDGTLFLGTALGEVTYHANALKPGAGNIYRLGGSLAIPGTSSAKPNTLIIAERDNILTGTASVQTAGSVKLMNANNFTGGISGGGVGIGHDLALGSGPVSVLGLTALNGPRTIANPLFLKDGSSYALNGPLTFTGPVDLGGGTPILYNPTPSSVRFTNRIGNGVLQVNYGLICQLDAANTFSALNLENASRVVVSSEANLGGPLAPIHFTGNNSDSPGTVETTASFTLHNPISIGKVYDSQVAGFDVAAGTTLTIEQVIPGSGTISKTGEGTLAFSSSTPFGGILSVEEGQVSTIGNSASFGSVYVYKGATFAGAGNMGNLFIEGGTVAPGGGPGMICVQCPTFSPSENPGQLEFEFTRKGSPIYTTPGNCRNGLLLLPPDVGGLQRDLEDCEISIFFATPTVEPGDVFRGAFAQQYLNGQPSAPLAITSRFSYYVPSPTGTISFHGKTYAPLDLTKYNVERSWHEDPAIPSFAGEPKPPFIELGHAGLVCQFKVVTGRILILSLPPPNGSVGHAYDFSYEASGLPAATFAVTSGKLPPGLTLNAEGELSGTPTAGGIFTGTVTASNGVLPLAKQNFSITIGQAPFFPGGPLQVSVPLYEPCSFTLQANGTPVPTFTFLSGGAPAGMSLSGDGVLSGTPQVKGTYTGVIAASNDLGQIYQSYSITVTDRLNKPPVFLSTTLWSTRYQTSYTYQLEATGFPAPTFAVTAGKLPPGMTLTPAGLVSGKATKIGVFPISITASNGTAPDALLSVPFNVEKKLQTITFPVVKQLKVGDVIPFEAKASSGLPVTYTILGPATLANNVLTCTQTGKITIKLRQDGDATYALTTSSFETTVQ